VLIGEKVKIMKILTYIIIINCIQKFTEIHNDCFPIKKVKIKSKSIKPWVTKGILKSIKRKNLLYQSYIKSPNITNKRNLLHIEIN